MVDGKSVASQASTDGCGWASQALEGGRNWASQALSHAPDSATVSQTITEAADVAKEGVEQAKEWCVFRNAETCRHHRDADIQVWHGPSERRCPTASSPFWNSEVRKGKQSARLYSTRQNVNENIWIWPLHCARCPTIARGVPESRGPPQGALRVRLSGSSMPCCSTVRRPLRTDPCLREEGKLDKQRAWRTQWRH